MTPRPLIVLEELHIPTPCHQDWARMSGTGRTRFCDSCGENVHDLKRYTREEVDGLLATANTPCVIITKSTSGRVRITVARSLRGWWKPARLFALLWALAATAFGASVGCSEQGKIAPRKGAQTPGGDEPPHAFDHNLPNK